MDYGSVRIIGYKFKVIDHELIVIKSGSGRLCINSGEYLDGLKIDELITDEISQRYKETGFDIQSYQTNFKIIYDQSCRMYQEPNSTFKDTYLSKIIKPFPIALVSIIGGYIIYKWISNSDASTVKS